jgi:hypothetical protein
VAQRYVGLCPRRLDGKSFGSSPHAVRQRLREVRDGLTDERIRDERDVVSLADGPSDRGSRNRHDVARALRGTIVTTVSCRLSGRAVFKPTPSLPMAPPSHGSKANERWNRPSGEAGTLPPIVKRRANRPAKAETGRVSPR